MRLFYYMEQSSTSIRLRKFAYSPELDEWRESFCMTRWSGWSSRIFEALQEVLLAKLWSWGSGARAA